MTDRVIGHVLATIRVHVLIPMLPTPRAPVMPAPLIPSCLATHQLHVDSSQPLPTKDLSLHSCVSKTYYSTVAHQAPRSTAARQAPRSTAARQTPRNTAARQTPHTQLHVTPLTYL